MPSNRSFDADTQRHCAPGNSDVTSQQIVRVADYRVLVEMIRGLAPPALVGIEGFTGSGKSHLADALASDLNAFVVHTDSFVMGEDETLDYLKRLDVARIAAATALAVTTHPLIIVEGICLRAVLRCANLSPTMFIYVKRIAENGLWHDGWHLDDFEARDPIAENCEEPHLSDFIYHAAERPHESANVVFERTEQSAES